jgi:outer membrane protein OmpA-like peptidoglycan-associated protein
MAYQWLIVVLMTAFVGNIAPAVAAEVADHPLVTSYPGSEARNREAKDFDTYRLITGVKADSLDFESTSVEGRLTRIEYGNPKGRSVAEIFANYEQALKDAGLTELFRCVDKECGPGYAGSRWNRFNGTINISGDARYLAGRLDVPEGQAYVAVAVARHQHQITVVEVKAMEEGLVSVNAEALGEDMDRYGHVAVPGIFFDTDKAVLKPQSDPALAEMAALLKGRPQLKVWIVGHTDGTGPFDHNLTLSKARAAAVAEALIQRFGIAAQRLGSHGVGPLAPVGSNTSDKGKAANRRVEIVARP